MRIIAFVLTVALTYSIGLILIGFLTTPRYKKWTLDDIPAPFYEGTDGKLHQFPKDAVFAGTNHAIYGYENKVSQ